MSDLDAAELTNIRLAMYQAFENGDLLVTTDGASVGQVRVIGSLDLDESIVRKALDDLYDGAVTGDPQRAARGSGFETKDGGQIGSGEDDFDTP